MRYVVNRWYAFSVYLAGAAALVLGLGYQSWSLEQVGLLMGLVFIQLHFFEEFGLPGGFVWGGIKVEKRRVPADVSSWTLNQASALFGNQWFALSVYVLPLLVPQWHWAVLASFIFAYAELLMHVVVFNIGLKRLYNPGCFTALCLAVVSTWYLVQTVPTGRYDWLDLGLALAWCGLNYVVAFLSPITRKLNSLSQFAFSREDVMKGRRYMDKFPGAAAALHGFRDE